MRLSMETILMAHQEKTSAPHQGWIGWAPLIVFTAAATLLRSAVPPWALMWILAIVIFSGFKWWTWWRAVDSRGRTTATRSLIYLFLWPGMDARRFLALDRWSYSPSSPAWIWALSKTIFSAGLVWGMARLAGTGLLAGWIGTVGFIFLLHFGLFAVLALFWQRQGIDAQPLMRCPIAAASLSDFWGKRWNSGFRDIVFGLMFIRLAKRFGTAGAALATFVISGLIHELVITFPTRADYGLPTLYFALQGAAMLLERSQLGGKLRLTRGWRGHAFALAVVTLPIFALFPPLFVVRVMVPFLQIIKALP
jgi:hypothetical protein